MGSEGHGEEVRSGGEGEGKIVEGISSSSSSDSVYQTDFSSDTTTGQSSSKGEGEEKELVKSPNMSKSSRAPSHLVTLLILLFLFFLFFLFIFPRLFHLLHLLFLLLFFLLLLLLFILHPLV